MRKPVVVAIVVLILLLLLTLARRLAQPAIADEMPERETPASLASRTEHAGDKLVHGPESFPPPVRPSAFNPGLGDKVTRSEFSHRSSEAKQVRQRSTAVKSKRASTDAVDAGSDGIVETPRQAMPDSYRALLGAPSPRIRRVMDHGAHGIGTPQWIEPLSGPKTRVPVRDFSKDEALNKLPDVAPLSLPVNSNTRSAADSAH
jgi:hypothetical protein